MSRFTWMSLNMISLNGMTRRMTDFERLGVELKVVRFLGDHKSYEELVHARHVSFLAVLYGGSFMSTGVTNLYNRF